jgi:hypothetical protein
MNAMTATISAAAIAILVSSAGAIGSPGSQSSQGPQRSQGPQGAQGALPAVTVYKSPTCGCCSKWVDHMKAAGFAVTSHDVDDVAAIKEKHGVPAEAGSCHTALVGTYVVEGHVPADAVKRMLRERPNIAGIAVPGMPVGSPGMEVPGRPADSYSIVAFEKSGKYSVYEKR